MLAIFSRRIIKSAVMILGWGLGLAILGYFLFDIFESMSDSFFTLQMMMEALPEGFMAFFGGNMNIWEPEGFLQIEFFSYMPVILGILVISGATGLIVKKEEEGTLELVLAQPVSRSAVFWAKTLALITNVILILVITWAGFALGLASTESFDLDQGQLILPFISLLAVLLVFLSLALMLSMILPTSGSATLVSSFVLIISYFITSLALLQERLETLNRFSPLKYYQGGLAISGLNVEYLLILMSISLVCLIIAWLLFEKRDLRFRGTGWMRLALKRKG